MPEKIIKLLQMIKESLWYNEERDNIIVIPEDDFTKNQLSIEDVKIGLETLIRKAIIENYYIRDRIYHHYPTNYEDKIKYIEDDIPYSGIHSEAVLGTLLYFIEIKDREKLMKFIKDEQEPNMLQDKQKVEFDSQVGVIMCGEKQYKIQSDVVMAKTLFS
jgi:hypothetical protein